MGSTATEKTAESLPVHKDPVLALILTILAPGLGHIYAGRSKRAVFWFLAANLCFGVGLWLARATIFQWSGASAIPPGAPKPLLLLLLPIPEICNLSATLLGATVFLGNASFAVDPPSWAAVLGSTLTGISGVLALLCMVDVWTLAKGGGGKGKGEMRACLLSWVLPGLGHAYLGKRFHARVFFFSVMGLYLVGTLLGGGLVASREKYFYYWAGQILLGAPTAAASIWSQGLHAEKFIPYQDLGLLLVTSAGLLNVLVMLSAYAMARGEK